MRKSILTALLITAIVPAFAQTKVNLSQPEATQVVNNLSKGLQLIHKLDIPALKRDSLDLLIGPVAQFIDDRNKLALRADTTKVKAKKP